MKLVDEDPENAINSLLPAYTSRSIIAFDPGVQRKHIDHTIRHLGGTVYDDSLIFEELGVAVVPMDLDHIVHQFYGGREGIVAVDRERISYAPPSNIVIGAEGGETSSPLEVMNVLRSATTGRGVRVAILDTGLKPTHPDFDGRRIRRKLFVADTPEDDDLGHGTHCAGLISGPLVPSQGVKRYGVASGVYILVGRVVNSYAMTTDGAMFAGLRWARRNRASIVNLSIGAPVDFGQEHSKCFERVAERLLVRDSILLVAGAGNDPPTKVHPVNHPANCPSIMAVAAVGPDFLAWNRSAGKRNPDGEINIAAPGYELLSSDIGSHIHKRRSGTSMASAYVSGVAALWRARKLCGRDLWAALVENTRTVAGASVDEVGAGLVQAP